MAGKVNKSQFQVTILISSTDKFRKKPLKKLSKQFAHANESAGEQGGQKDVLVVVVVVVVYGECGNRQQRAMTKLSCCQ